MRELAAAFLHLLFPVPCLVCSSPLDAQGRSMICGSCWMKVRPSREPFCLRCGWPFPSPQAVLLTPEYLCGPCRERRVYFSSARAAALYEEGGVMRQAILALKYGRKVTLGRHLGAFMAEAAYGRVDVAFYDRLIPVPLHQKREKERGFNQALILAEALSRRFGVPVERKALVRSRSTNPQEGNRKAREENVERAFQVVRPERIIGKRVLLIDDVYTTGATVNECAKVLVKAGAQEAAVYTLARVL
ncbi:MAG: ComF family protein [candidate division NC10 bacterium]|nr:ComF family protein [candidate division NC10 bacterium]